MKYSIMKKQILFTLIMIFAVLNNSYSQEDREKWIAEEITGIVTFINKESRGITVTGPDGNMVTFTAGEEVERFNEINDGDIIKFQYLTYIKAEFRAPNEEELAEPFVMIAETAKAPKDVPPGAAIGAMVKAVVTIVGLNSEFMTAIVKGPRGNFMTVPVEDITLLEQLHINQVLVMTYGEAIALSLEKVTLGTN